MMSLNPQPEPNAQIYEKSPKTQLSLSRTIQVQNENFEIASDWHLPMDRSVLDKMIATLKMYKHCDVFVCMGDIFDAGNCEDTSKFVSEFLTKLAEIYPAVLYSPGNHCIRSRDNPWLSFELPQNVHMPIAEQPLIIQTENNKILVGNCFYDLEFIDCTTVGFSEEMISDFYVKTNDGKSLLRGDVSLFKKMAVNLAKALTPDITMMVTHTLPHPALVNFRVPAMTDYHRELALNLGIPFICDLSKDSADAAIKHMSPEELRTFWNLKSIVMGSNILNRPEANPRDGLVALYGHNHRGSEMNVNLFGVTGLYF